MTIRVACSGFPVGKSLYTTKLKTVELSQLFDTKPRRSTVEKWREEAPAGFEFIVCASKIITHPVKTFATGHGHHRPHKIGGFQESAEVRNAVETTLETARILKTQLIFFQLPSTFSANADNVGRLQAFLGRFQKGSTQLVWEPPSSWPLSMVELLSRRQALIPAYNPLNERYDGLSLPVRYFRIGKEGSTGGVMSLTDSHLRQIKAKCGGMCTYVVFNNGPTSFSDAARFSDMLVANRLHAQLTSFR